MPQYLTVSASGQYEILGADGNFTPTGEYQAHRRWDPERRKWEPTRSNAIKVEDSAMSRREDLEMRAMISNLVAEEIAKREQPHRRRQVRDDLTRAARHFRDTSERLKAATNGFEAMRTLENNVYCDEYRTQQQIGKDFEDATLRRRRELQEFHAPREQREQRNNQEPIAVPPAEEDFDECCRATGKVIAARTTPRRQMHG